MARNHKNERRAGTGTSDEEMNGQGRPNKKEKKKIRPAYVVTAISVLVLAAVLAVLFWPTKEEPPEERRTVSGGRGSVLTLDNLEQERERLNGASPDAQYTVSMTTEWEFATWDSPSRNARVDNLERNSRAVYIDVTLNDTGELVYSSPYVPLGETLRGFALDSPVAAGEHAATVTYVLVDDDHQEVTTVSIHVTLRVLE